MFDESPGTLFTRCGGLGIDLGGAGRGRALIELVQVDPAELSPGELACTGFARRSKPTGSKMVVIDSLNGYLNAMPEERFLIIQLHELLMYLVQKGVATC